MVRLIALLCLALLALPSASAAEWVYSGSFVANVVEYNPMGSPEQNLVRWNALSNPGFESGTLAPWYTSGWVISDLDAYEGNFCAEGIGNHWLRQDFAGIDVTTIQSISMWSMQPEGVAFQAVDYFYGPGDFDEFLVAPGRNWTFLDMTARLRPVGFLTGIGIWGYSGGGPDPDLTRCDLVTVDVDEDPVPTSDTTWGRVKALYR